MEAPGQPSVVELWGPPYTRIPKHKRWQDICWGPWATAQLAQSYIRPCASFWRWSREMHIRCLPIMHSTHFVYAQFAYSIKRWHPQLQNVHINSNPPPPPPEYVGSHDIRFRYLRFNTFYLTTHSIGLYFRYDFIALNLIMVKDHSDIEKGNTERIIHTTAFVTSVGTRNSLIGQQEIPDGRLDLKWTFYRRATKA